MSNIDIYKEYIQDCIINRIERLMGNDEADDLNLWVKYGSKGLTPQKDSIYRSTLRRSRSASTDSFMCWSCCCNPIVSKIGSDCLRS